MRYRKLYKTVLPMVVAWLLTGCGNTPAPSRVTKMVPEWYTAQSLTHESYEIIGYGEGMTPGEAKARARSDIAKTLETTVSSRLTARTHVEDNEVSHLAELELSEESAEILSDLILVQIQENAGRYYVALKFDNLPLDEKIFRRFPHILKEVDDKLLHTSPLLQKLKKHYGYFPKLHLYSQEGRYYFIEGDTTSYVPQSELPALFPAVHSSAVSIEAPTLLREGASYTVKLQAKTSGYLNYLQVFETGETVLLLANEKVEKGITLTFPDPEKFDGLEAELPENKAQSRDLHIVLLCPDKADFSLFDSMRESQNADYHSFLLGTLYDVSTGCEAATTTMQIVQK